ncbi:MAG: 16S rRNA (guanine(527)-N(7))-methyltransferase RsmG [Armatimonadota bacterium]|nr:16S rRNA (guanine(527)-N(7))-methyltransferase RsmG [Armatimonadota bacterium]
MLEPAELELLRDGALQLGVELDGAQLGKFSLYTSLLLEWNRKFNLTRITDPREIVLKHYLDSLTCLAAAKFPLDANVVDVGAGAGFPGVPIEIARPDLNVALLDSTRKRIAFLEEVVEKLALAGVSLLLGRAEDAGHDAQRREFYDIAVARAVARMNVLVEYCLPLVRSGGFALLQKGPDAYEELSEARPAITLLGGEIEKVVTLKLPHSDATRNLVIIRKTLGTPAAYPRRPAVIQREPL